MGGGGEKGVNPPPLQISRSCENLIPKTASFFSHYQLSNDNDIDKDNNNDHISDFYSRSP